MSFPVMRTMMRSKDCENKIKLQMLLTEKVDALDRRVFTNNAGHRFGAQVANVATCIAIAKQQSSTCFLNMKVQLTGQVDVPQ